MPPPFVQLDAAISYSRARSSKVSSASSIVSLGGPSENLEVTAIVDFRVRTFHGTFRHSLAYNALSSGPSLTREATVKVLIPGRIAISLMGWLSLSPQAADTLEVAAIHPSRIDSMNTRI